MKVLPYFHGHFGPLIKSLISSSIGDDIVPLVAVHATRALNNHPINSTIFFTCNLRFSNMKSKDRDKWMEAADLEIKELESKATWVEVPMSDAKTKPIPGTWFFRHKRTPSGEIKKYK